MCVCDNVCVIIIIMPRLRMRSEVYYSVSFISYFLHDLQCSSFCMALEQRCPNNRGSTVILIS